MSALSPNAKNPVAHNKIAEAVAPAKRRLTLSNDLGETRRADAGRSLQSWPWTRIDKARQSGCKVDGSLLKHRFDRSHTNRNVVAREAIIDLFYGPAGRNEFGAAKFRQLLT
jgi:hypothetical protein